MIVRFVEYSGDNMKYIDTLQIQDAYTLQIQDACQSIKNHYRMHWWNDMGLINSTCLSTFIIYIYIYILITCNTFGSGEDVNVVYVTWCRF